MVDWHKDAFEVYRLTWAELLEHWKPPRRDDVDYYVEELKEALLDLKQSVAEDDSARAMQSIEEVLLLLAELRLRS